MNQQLFPYSAFEAYVNRFRVRDILIQCNILSNRAGRLSAKDALEHIGVSPWGLAFIAKTSLLRSTDNRQQELTEGALNQLLLMQANLDDALGRDDTDVDGFMIRTTWEQFPYQEGMTL